ncbi:hypothetical protein [Blastomonas sp.]|uniref:hypothetical protein n=1 Tax=Alphaproteobacteria TaxID=28211 RepID=UPI00263353B0|nr:hypothetical protein [Blastomonas sp.]MDM7957972.1 hypothetical protein [Blastomonas sp.]
MIRTIFLGLSTVVVASLVISPASAQRKTHGAGVSWSGGHGGVSWDGGHAYEGGSYGGYPAASPPSPAYKPPPPAYRMPQPSPDPIARSYPEHDWRGGHRYPDHAGRAERR